MIGTNFCDFENFKKKTAKDVTICRPDWMQRSELFCRVMLPALECDEIGDPEEANSCRMCSCITAGMSNGLQCTLDEETGRCYYPGEGFRFPDSYKAHCSMKNKDEYHCFVREGMISK